jgi:hypothetical protein
LAQEDGEVAVVRGLVFPARIANPSGRVIEPELDMNRLPSRQSPARSMWRELLRKLLPGGGSLVRPPMRSIAREIEEAWPSGEL